MHEKARIFHQGETAYFLWTEVGFKVNLPEGLTLRIYLTAEKEQYILENEIDIKQCQSI